MEQFRWLTVSPPTWNPNPVSPSIKKTATWDNSPKSVVRTWDFIHPGPPYPEGDDFTSASLTYPLFQVKGSGVFNSTPSPGVDKFRYTGGFIPSSFAGDFVSFSDLMNDQKWGPNGSFTNESLLASLGTSALIRSIPKVSYANLAEFVGEAGDIPQQFKTSARGFSNLWVSIRDRNFRSSPFMPKEAGEHFLNHQFGWVPFVSDLKKFCDLTINLRQHIIDAYKQNDVWVHVGKRLTEDHSVSVIQRGFTMNVNPSGFQFDTMQNTYSRFGNTCRAYYELQHIETSNAWSSGFFKIYRPEFDDSRPSQFEQLRKIRQLLTLYGANINPSVLWELTPWSWLIDYFTNIGDLIKILTRTQFDSAVAKSFFVMRTSESTFNFFQELNWNSGLETIEWPRIMRVLVRRKADNPYQFRSTLNLSSMQIAILAALGLSRGKSASA